MSLVFVLLLSTTVMALDMNNATGTVESVGQQIGGWLSSMSPFLLIGLGILLFFIQKIAKIAGIILLLVGLVRLIFMFL